MLYSNHATKFYRHALPEITNKAAKDCVEETIALRQNLTEQQIDDTIEDSFPASDPAPWY